MVRENVLSPAESGEYIFKHAKFVKIHEEGINKLCDEMMKSMKNSKLEIPDIGGDMIHPSKSYPRAVDWVFVCDTLNFCFWSLRDSEKWTVDAHTGYYALEAALHRAIQEGHDITNPVFYSKITTEQLQNIMRGDNQAQIPLLSKRIEVLHEVGTILLEKFNGTFETCVKEADKSAVRLLEIIVDNFPCFRDEANYSGKVLGIYKRAQILVADLWNFFDGSGWGEFKDIDKITMFADYRVPQVLVYFGAMSYSAELMEKLRNDVLVPNGSEEEVEIRGCSIHAVELLKRRLVEKCEETREEIQLPNSSLVDYYLWCYRRKYTKQIDAIPFHKTLSIYY